MLDFKKERLIKLFLACIRSNDYILMQEAINELSENIVIQALVIEDKGNRGYPAKNIKDNNIIDPIEACMKRNRNMDISHIIIDWEWRTQMLLRVFQNFGVFYDIKAIPGYGRLLGELMLEMDLKNMHGIKVEPSTPEKKQIIQEYMQIKYIEKLVKDK